MTVMIPKVTSEGERPIALFRTVVRIMAKAKAWRAAGWLEDNSPEYLSMARGRRVGDGMWRIQLRSLISEEQGQQSAEVMLDLRKAFELAQRDRLLEAASAAGYPLDARIWASRCTLGPGGWCSVGASPRNFSPAAGFCGLSFRYLRALAPPVRLSRPPRTALPRRHHLHPRR